MSRTVRRMEADVALEPLTIAHSAFRHCPAASLLLTPLLLTKECFRSRLRSVFRMSAVGRLRSLTLLADVRAAAMPGVWLVASRNASATTEEVQAKARAASEVKRKAAESQMNNTMFIFDRAVKAAQVSSLAAPPAARNSFFDGAAAASCHVSS